MAKPTFRINKIRRARLDYVLISYADATRKELPLHGFRNWSQKLVEYAARFELTKRCHVDGQIVEMPYQLGPLMQAIRYMMRHYSNSKDISMVRFCREGCDAITLDRLKDIQYPLNRRAFFQDSSKTDSQAPTITQSAFPSQDNETSKSIMAVEEVPQESNTEVECRPSSATEFYTPVTSPTGVPAQGLSGAAIATSDSAQIQPTDTRMDQQQGRQQIPVPMPDEQTERDGTQPPFSAEAECLQGAMEGCEAASDLLRSEKLPDLSSAGATAETPQQIDDGSILHSSQEPPSSVYNRPVSNMENFGLRSSQVEGAMNELFNSIVEVTWTAFQLAGIEISQIVDLEVQPKWELQGLYQCVFGVLSWRVTAAKLRFEGVPSAFDALVALIGAAVYMLLRSKYQPWQESSSVSFASDLDRRHVETTLEQYGGISLDALLHMAAYNAVRDPEYVRNKLEPEAISLAESMHMSLCQHISRLTAHVPAKRHHAFGPNWISGLTKVFEKVLVLTEKLRVARETFPFCWYDIGHPIRCGLMKERYPSEEHDIVLLTLFPGVQIHEEDQRTSTTIFKARVIGGKSEAF